MNAVKKLLKHIDGREIEMGKLREALANLLQIINAHEIESLQCDGKDQEHCDCLRLYAKKAGLLLSSVKADPAELLTPPAPTATDNRLGSGDLSSSVVRSRAEWLDLLHRCQDGEATCLYVLGEMEAEVDRVSAGDFAERLPTYAEAVHARELLRRWVRWATAHGHDVGVRDDTRDFLLPNVQAEPRALEKL